MPTPRVESVSVSTPRMVMINGIETTTAIIKQVATSPVFFGMNGPEGNSSAVHNEAVYVFIAEHYDHWATTFGVERANWQFGHWGENLTISGLLEHNIHIGDMVSVGDELVMQVTSPRFPCFKLTWRLGQPETAIGQLAESGLVDFYLRVITPGKVSAGDAVKVHRQYESNLSVTSILNLVSDKQADIDTLQRAVTMPGLSSLPITLLSNWACP